MRSEVEALRGPVEEGVFALLQVGGSVAHLLTCTAPEVNDRFAAFLYHILHRDLLVDELACMWRGMRLGAKDEVWDFMLNIQDVL